MRQADATRRQRHRRPRFYALTAVGAIIAIVVLAIIIDSALYHNKIHAGVSISGISMGGSTRDDAAAQLNKLVEQAQNSKITLTDGERTWSVLPTDMGTKMDVAGAVSAAMEASRKSNFIVDLGHKLKLYFSSVDIPLTGTIDSAMTDKVLNDLSAQIDTTPVNAGLTLENGQVKVIEGQKGQVVDKDKLREELESLVLSLHSTELTIPLKEQDPAIQAQDTQDAVNQANTMLSAPVALTSGKKSWSITTDQIASYLGFTTQMVNGVSTLVPFLAADKMQPFFDQIASEVATEPVDAKIKTDGKKAWVEQGVPGKKLDPVKTAEAVSQAALQTSGRTMEVAVTTVDPDLTTAEAEAMGVKDLLSSYTTPPYVGTANRQINVRITTEYASDVLLAPGEIYNFDKQIGPRTAARGYKTAPGIVGPGKLEDVFGGGICQVSTTLFNAAFFAGLEIVERKNHSIYIDHYPKGRDATVSAGSPNLRFKNNTAHYILVKGISDGITTTFNIYGTSDGRKTTVQSTSDFYNVVGRTTVTELDPTLAPGTQQVKTNGQSGKQCKVVRKITWPDGTVKTDTFISTYPMIPKTILVGPPASTTTTIPGQSSTTTPTTAPATTTTTSF